MSSKYNKLNLSQSKGFTLIELLVVIAVIGIISSILLVGFKGARESAYSARGKANRKTAVVYCLSNPGSSTITALNKNGDPTNYPVYCDKYGNMWAPTLHDGMNTTYGTGTLNVKPDTGTKQFKWAKESPYNSENVWLYTYGEVNDCNEVKPEYMEYFSASNACATLNYAGFSEGWRLPSHSDVGQEGIYCFPNSQLWKYGEELCSKWGSSGYCSSSPGECTPPWEGTGVAKADYYWSATQSGKSYAWSVPFTSATASNSNKSYFHYVRCFLGQW